MSLEQNRKSNNNVAAELDLTNFATYEDYLDTHVTPQDLMYLEDQDLVRQVVELGYKGKELLSREEFEERKKRILEGPKVVEKKEERLVSLGKDVDDFPLLKALAKREEYVRNGKLAV